MVRVFDLALDHVQLYCSDLAATEHWFTTCLDAELLKHRTNRGAPASDSLEPSTGEGRLNHFLKKLGSLYAGLG